jgi:GNAT superfamily N-acetyltransferase
VWIAESINPRLHRNGPGRRAVRRRIGHVSRLVGPPTGTTVDSVPAARVTRLTESDWEQFAELRLRALTDAFGTADQQYLVEARFTASDWRRRLRDHAQFAAVLGGWPVGIVAAYQESTQAAYVYSLWLEPAARGRGLAQRLGAAAVDWARGRGVRTATLRMAPDNVAARKVYENLGFTEVPTGGSPAEVVMRLTIR